MALSKTWSSFGRAKLACFLLVVGMGAISPAVMAQATTRPCSAGSSAEDQAGPACLLAHAQLGRIAHEAVYWSLYTYPSIEAAQQDRVAGGTVVPAYGRIWLFTVGPLSSRPANGAHIKDIGPIAVSRNASYDAEFLRSTFTPGMTAPIHVHSGPEAFYAISGDTCLETPDGVQVGRGPGNSLLVRGGPPMLLMATGNEMRRGFALILHDPSRPPTTLVQDWKPKGLCRPEHGAGG